ncbi:MAG: AAA family ATPase [Anaerolineae bacterium]
MSHRQARELTPEELTYVCDASQYTFETTDEIPDLPTIIGQERAIRALEFGIHIPSYGFNVYVTGPAGSGRSTTVMGFLRRKAEQEAVPDDWCYVNNFRDARRPRAIRLPAGYGIQLRDDMATFIRDLQSAIPVAFDSEDYQQRVQSIMEERDQARDQILSRLSKTAETQGFGLVQTATGLALVPMLDGEVVTPEKYAAASEEQRKQWESAHIGLQQELERALREIRVLNKTAREHLRALTREVADFVVREHIEELLGRYHPFQEVITYLEEVRQDIVEHVADFYPELVVSSGPLEEEEEETASSNPSDPPPEETLPDLSRYQVNVIVDNSQTSGAPVVYETSPSYTNLVGRIEQEVRYGVLSTDFTLIRAGSLHRANGGYLVLNARDLLEYPLAWEALKRTIRNQEIRTEMPSDLVSAPMTTSLEPECIPFKAKVILIGDWSTYEMLYELDDDFRKIFKVRADFAISMERTHEAMQQYAQFIARRVRADGLLPFHRSAVARIVEIGARLVEDKHKLSTRFSGILEVIHEASYWAGVNGHRVVTAEDVDQAMREGRYRASHLPEQIRRQILEDVLHVETEGWAVGQVNGMTVIEVADYEFAIPSRISAQTYMGRGNVVAIDREANLAGNIHNKGVLILQGFLGARYAQRKPLNLSASLTFEQSYDRIEGDSASSAELYAILSSLSGLPVRQDLAVTGAVDQQGRILAVGSVTAKIEGFFDLCQARGLTGTQGVVIPEANVRHLVLRPDVVQAVREGKFHVYAVSTVDEGIALLTGVPAGEPDVEGNYPEGTVNYRVQKRLLEMAEEKGEHDEEEEDCDVDRNAADGADAQEYAYVVRRRRFRRFHLLHLHRKFRKAPRVQRKKSSSTCSKTRTPDHPTRVCA